MLKIANNLKRMEEEKEGAVFLDNDDTRPVAKIEI